MLYNCCVQIGTSGRVLVGDVVNDVFEVVAGIVGKATFIAFVDVL